MNPALQGYTAAIVDSTTETGALDALALDVAAVEHQISASPELRAAMTDVALSRRARRVVLADLLTGKVGPSAERLCAYAVGAVGAGEVPNALSWVRHRLSQLAAGRDLEEDLLALGQARERVLGYASALFEDCSVGDLEEMEDEVFRFARTVGATPSLRRALGDRDLPARLRSAIADDLIAEKVSDPTRRLVRYAIVGGRPRDIVGTLDWLVEQTAVARGWRVARVEAGQEIDPGEHRKLADSLSRVAGAPVELQVEVDPRLLAGVSVELGDLRIDATALGRLERLREHVGGSGWIDLGYGRAARAHEALQAEPPRRRDVEGPRDDGDEGGADPRG